MKEHSKFFLNSLDDTEKFAKKITKIINNGVCICLNGKLGIGKTTLVKFILKNYLGKKINVSSPTFSLVNLYETNNLRIWHYDLYRLKKKKECLNIGLFEDDDVISIIEWPEKVHFKPKKRIEIYFKYFDNYNSRLLKIKFFGKNEA